MTQLQFVSQKIEFIGGTVHAFVPCPRGPATRPHGIVLYEGEGYHPFIVHYIDTENGARWEGGYHGDIHNAYLDFCKRVSKQVSYVENGVPLAGTENDTEYRKTV